MMKRMRQSRELGIGGITARWYDKNTRKHRLAEMKQYAQEVSHHIKTDNAVLEVAPGPGYFAIELAKLGKYKITGFEISRDVVETHLKTIPQQADNRKYAAQSILFNLLK
jgi:2-polyprenyl-3-methyl-5-hydroxy-6-metoxy-1,4-benzoquinol methylase